VDFLAKVNDDHDYKPYYDAYKQGILKEEWTSIRHLSRLFTARMKLGMFDPPEMVSYSKIDEKELDSAEHRAMALDLANKSMILLKNDGILPFEEERNQDCGSGPAGGPVEVPAWQLHRHSFAHRLGT
jgi:beta-glucosidase